MSNIPFQLINWNEIIKVEYPSEKGKSIWQTIQFEGLRIRIVEYSPDFLADHWCAKGHIVHCLEGSFITELAGDDPVVLNQGMSFVVSDNLSSHLSISENGAKLLIIDGDFLKN
ncbi:hypothetical protein EGI26_13270 [Lacihabitans sp. CCS-44]|uniref:DHCW motif cupin fold protein n=1 Tax=Lacihabitans sp. CCS-44 TaxID=2487331 RepID=UPI0020CBA29E|nr:DHCW motif cupin fold protein [Lacihabitans sp. CCS-44]MCP9756126.1 hypothetical protein [Lacihabitans sp. CCS-44]